MAADSTGRSRTNGWQDILSGHKRRHFILFSPSGRQHQRVLCISAIMKLSGLFCCMIQSRLLALTLQFAVLWDGPSSMASWRLVERRANDLWFLWLPPPSNGKKDKMWQVFLPGGVLYKSVHVWSWYKQCVGHIDVTHILKHLSFPPLATLCPSVLQSTAKT